MGGGGWWVVGGGSGGMVVVCKPILVFSLSLGQAEQLFLSDTRALDKKI